MQMAVEICELSYSGVSSSDEGKINGKKYIYSFLLKHEHELREFFSLL